MVFSASAPDDASGPDERPWLERLSGILRLVRRGVIVLVDRACPERLGDLVRGVLADHPEVDVVTNTAELTRAQPGSLVILIPRAEQAGWLNLERPLFANRELRVILFSDAETSGVLARKAPDFFNWISHRLECPRGASPSAISAIRAALRMRAPGILFRGGDLETVFREALPGRSLEILSSAMPYSDMVEAMRERGKGWIAWTDVDGPFRLRRVRWAAAEAGRRGRIALIEPGVEPPGFVPVDGRVLEISEARTQLSEAGALRPGRLAALVDLEAEAVHLAKDLLRVGVPETRLFEQLRTALDPGASLLPIAMEKSLEVPPGIAARSALGPKHRADEAEGLLRRSQTGPDLWIETCQKAIDSGDYDVAVRWGRRAVELVELGGGVSPAQSGSALHFLGDALYKQGSYKDAEHILRRALAQMDAAPELDHPQHEASIRTLAVALAYRGSYEEAEQLLRRSLARQEEMLGTESPEYGASLRRLADVSVYRGDLKEAEQLARRAVLIHEKVLGTEHPEYATSLRSLAEVLRRLGNFEEAAEIAPRAALIHEKTLGIEHPEHILSLCSFAILVLHQGIDEDEEEAFLQKLMVLWRKSLGENHPGYANLLHQMAQIRVRQGNYEEAERLLRRALALKEQTLGADHPSVLITRADLGTVLAEQGRAEEGLAHVERAFRTATTKYGSSHPDIAVMLVKIAQLQAATRHPEAPSTARRALDMLMSTLGPSHGAVQQALPLLLSISADKEAPTIPPSQDAPVTDGPPIRQDLPCPCGSGKPFAACHGREPP